MPEPIEIGLPSSDNYVVENTYMETPTMELKYIDDILHQKFLKKHLTYGGIEYTVLGILKKKLEGKWKLGEEYELEAQFYISSIDETHMKNFTTLDNDWFKNDRHFYHRSEAEEMIKTLDKQAKEMDMK